MFEKIIAQAINFYHNYPVVVIVVAVILLIFAYNKPKESFKFAIFLVILACALYAVGLFGKSIETGKENKNQMVEKTKGLGD